MPVNTEITFQVYGNYALFTDPVTKIGGEKMSMPVPTYGAIKGIIESVYWKPSIIWVVDEVRILNPIRMEAKGVKPRNNDGSNSLAYYSYLQNVCYEVKAHFVFNHNRPNLQSDFNANKHLAIAKRSIEKGGRRDVFLGTRECPAYVEPCEYGKEPGYYDQAGEMTFGIMVHSIGYPDETGENHLETRLWQPVMTNGVIAFIPPNECPLVRPLHNYQIKDFSIGVNMTSVDATAQEVLGEEC